MFSRNYHQNFNILHVNTKRSHNYFIPFGKEQDPFALRENSACFILLNGLWDFIYYNSMLYVEETLPRLFKDKIPVPANWQFHGYGIPSYMNTRYPIHFNPPYVPQDNPVGIYRKMIQLEQVEKMEYSLHFEGVDSCFYIYINEQFVGYSQVTHMTSEFDVTSYLINGVNEILVIVLQWCDGTYLECQDKWKMSGIIRDVYLIKRPIRKINQYKISYSFSDSYQSMKLLIKMNSNTDVLVKLYNQEGVLLGNKQCGVKEHMMEVIFRLKNPILWSAEEPYLYRITLETEEEIIGEKVGFHNIKVVEDVLLINGVPEKLKGVSRHDSDLITGAIVSREEMMFDLYLMKASNINTIRTSHYPNCPYFLQLCDELGFYVIEEADIESHGSEEAGITLAVSMPEFENQILDRIQRMIYRDQNRPCVIAWSLGNRSGYGKAFEKAADWIYSLDKERLIHYESMVPFQSMGKTQDKLNGVSHMYISTEWIAKELLRNKKEAEPYFLCEYGHAMGNSFAALEECWNLIYSTNRLVGNCDLEWCDLVYPDRKPHTNLYELKNIYRPIRVIAKNIKKGEYISPNSCDC